MTTTTGPTTTTTTDPASTTTTTATTAESGAKVMQADDGSWRLEQVDRAGHRCLQLIAGATRATDLLCNASPPFGLWGGYAAVSTPLGPMVVALVDPAVTGVETLMGQGFTGKVAADPADSALHYAAGVLRDVGIFLKGGDNTLGRTAINSSPGPHPAPDVVTTAPYGARPGYRKAGYTGFVWGGNEEVGFYDAPAADGTRCLLWRRFGGSHEGVVLDVCPGATDNRFPLARLLSEAPMATDLVRPAVLVDAPRVTGWSYSWDAAPSSPTGASGPLPPEYGQVFADPAQPGRFFLGYFPGAIGRQGTELTVTAYDGPTVVGTVTVTAPTG
jgi:hypothetical protein